MADFRFFLAGARLALLLLPLAGAAAPERDPRLTELLAELDRLRIEAGVAGAGLVLVSESGPAEVHGLGRRGWDCDCPVEATTVFRIGSITKAFTGLAFLRLAEQGRLALEAPVAGLLDPVPYSNPWAPDSQVTVAQLLEHTAGLGDLSKKEWDHNTPLPLAAALAVDPESRRLRWPPGRHSSYSNSGAGVAAYAMEQATGLDFEAYAAAQVFAPLKMGSASFALKPEFESRLARGYDTDGRTPIRYWHTLYRPFGGINVELSEMQHLLRMLLDRGRLDGVQVFAASSIARMESPRTTLAARQGLGFGYGLGNYHYLHRGFVFHGHGGDADGYLSHFGYQRERGLGYFLVINAFQGRTLKRMRERIEDFIVGPSRPSFAPRVPQPRAHLSALAGTYQAVTRRFDGAGEPRLEVAFKQGQVYLKRGARVEVLIPLSRWLFRRRFEPVATSAFIEHAGRVYLQGPFGNYVRAVGSEPNDL